MNTKKIKKEIEICEKKERRKNYLWNKKKGKGNKKK